MPNVITPKVNRTVSGPESAAGRAAPLLQSSVGGKYTVAITGLLLVGFVLAHLAGNLQILAGIGNAALGQDTLNSYAKFLKDKGPLLWAARAGLLAVFVLHLGLALWLNWQNRQARPVRYAYENTVQATWASRYMVWTGIVVGLFLLFHLAHYTLGTVKGATVIAQSAGHYEGINFAAKEQFHVNYAHLHDGKNRHDVYNMVIAGFSNPLIVSIYILAQVALFFHLRHGIASVFQTLGLSGRGSYQMLSTLAIVVAGLIAVGNIAMPLLVYTGVIGPAPLHLANPDGTLGVAVQLVVK
jgi:succinate dehydrogenase / fumarate reductase cytochrome b subunit